MLAAPKTIRKKPANSCKNPQTPANPEISLFWVFFWYMDAVLRSCAKDTYLYKKVNHFVRCLTYLLGTTRPSAAEGRGTQKHLVVCIWPVTATQPTAYDNGIYNIFAQQEMSQEFQGNLVELFFFQKIVAHQLQQAATALLQHTRHNSTPLEVESQRVLSVLFNVLRHLCPCRVL